MVLSSQLDGQERVAHLEFPTTMTSSRLANDKESSMSITQDPNNNNTKYQHSTNLCANDKDEVIKSPSYTPSYVRPLGSTRPRIVQRSDSTQQYKWQRNKQSRRAVRRSNSDFNFQASGYSLLRKKYGQANKPAVRVKETVAKMEERMNTELNNLRNRKPISPRPISPTKKPVPSIHKPVPSVKMALNDTEKAKSRGSTTCAEKSLTKSVTYDKSVKNNEVELRTPQTSLKRNSRHRRSMSDPNLHKTFRQVKALWDEKAQIDKQSQSSSSRGGSITSLCSLGSNPGYDKKSHRCGSTESLEIGSKNLSVKDSAGAKSKPKVSPKPDSKRERAETASPKVHVPEGLTAAKTMTSSSVSERAMLFGGTNRGSYTKPNDNRQSSGTKHHRKSWSDDSAEQLMSGRKASDDVSHIYDEVCPGVDEPKRLIVDDVTNDCWNQLHFVRRSSKDSLASKKSSLASSPIHSPMAIRKSENALFGGSSSPPMRLLKSPEAFEGRRRASSLHDLMAVKPGALPVAKKAQKPAVQPSNRRDEVQDSPERPNFLALQRKRSKTYSNNSSLATPVEDNSAGSDLEEKNRTSSSPPEVPLQSQKPTRSEHNDSADDSRPGSRTRSDAMSIRSSSTRSGSVSILDDFNPLEEYEKIAQQVSEDDSPQFIGTESKRSSDVTTDSDLSVNARGSLLVPGRSGDRSSWSDFSDEEEPIELKVPGSPGPPPKKETIETKIHNIVKELLGTEESYVAVLHLIDQVFHKKVRDAASHKSINMPESVVNTIFCHVPAIYQFHSSFLLPQLQERLSNWENNPRIGDIMTKAAPFLKMYSLYVQNFDEAMNAIKVWSEKSSGFKSIVKDIQKLPECNSLTLQHHMLGPVQRVPRYKLLLEDYLKRLPEDSPDRPDALTACNLITVAATHSNETMKKIDKFHKLVNVFNKLSDVNFDIVDVSRELLKEGKITKISARNGEKYERYLYLFSDMLLCCTPLGRLQGKSYKVTAKIDLDGMQLTDVKNPTVPNAFIVRGFQKSMECAASSADEKESWVQAINDAIAESLDRKESFMKQGSIPGTCTDKVLSPVDQQPITNGVESNSPSHHSAATPFVGDIADSELGTRAPRWIKDNEVTMCMHCHKAFNKLLRRRHHCRACGKVVCSECSEHKTTLSYEPGKPQKVCSDCYNVLTGRNQFDSVDGEKRGVLEVEADIVSENSVIANYLFFCDNEKKKTWSKTWCVIPNGELCLYFYGAHQDVRAQMTMPLPGFEVTVTNSQDHKHTFKLSQARKTFFFGTDDRNAMDRWVFALQEASKGEDLTKEWVFSLGKIKNIVEYDDLTADKPQVCSKMSNGTPSSEDS